MPNCGTAGGGIAFRLGADLGGPEVTDAEAHRAVAEVFLALEVIDSRIADWKITLVDPVKAVVWLARRLSGFGETLRAGQLTLAGAVHASRPLTRGTWVTASAPGFGPVRLLVR